MKTEIKTKTLIQRYTLVHDLTHRTASMEIDDDGQYLKLSPAVDANLILHRFNNFEPLLEALKEAHKAIDILFAQRIAMDESFFPSKSGQPWKAMVQANEAIQKAEASSV